MHVLRAQTLNSQYLKSQTGHTHILPLFESTIDPLLHIELSFLSLFFVKDCKSLEQETLQRICKVLANQHLEGLALKLFNSLGPYDCFTHCRLVVFY